ncbi:MAG: hypothetical protein MJK08_14520 [Campylobacterales bacterium]|nr:hypothetical protein [Campylobacterales bacterium]
MDKFTNELSLKDVFVSNPPKKRKINLFKKGVNNTFKIIDKKYNFMVKLFWSQKLNSNPFIRR